jgi:hypothetical protein
LQHSLRVVLYGQEKESAVNVMMEHQVLQLAREHAHIIAALVAGNMNIGRIKNKTYVNIRHAAMLAMSLSLLLASSPTIIKNGF